MLTHCALARYIIFAFVANNYSVYAVVRFLSLIIFHEICIQNLMFKELKRGLIQNGAPSNFPQFYNSVLI